MKILILSQWYPPEPDTRIHLLAKTLVERGHQVTSITGFPNYPCGKLYPGYKLRWRQWETMDGVRVLRVPLYPEHSTSGFKRILNYLSFAISAALIGGMLCGSADVMWVYHPPLTVALPAWWISFWRHIPFIYEIQDLWPETLAATGMMSSPRMARWIARAAKLVHNKSAAITVISPGFKRNLINKGVASEKIHVIPNWADEELYRPVPRDEALAREFGFDGRFNIVYGGNLGAAQALHTVLDAAQRLRDLPDVQIVLIGDGVDARALQDSARQRGLTNLRIVGRQPSERMPFFFALADAVLVHLKRDPVFEITIPGKTTAYLACGRPILCAVAGDAAEMVQMAGAGVTCPPEDPEALALAVRDLYTMPREQREALGDAGRRTFLEKYTRAALVDQYETLFQNVFARKQARAKAFLGNAS
ncbi:MAG: glycosyltransferase family 4 protein [Chloroflexi bacterium]|nr:glycosyltransferase family 4 protein [Chloroflexota bacterium]